MKVLVLAEDYTTLDGKVSLHYIHSRNLIYVKKEIDVSVLSFRAQKNYVIDGIDVYTEKTYRNEFISKKFDIILCHAPNIRNHLRFLKKYSNKFAHIVFFFHGHEVLRGSRIYPKGYSYIKKQSLFKSAIKEIYDILKLYIWKKEIPKLVDKSQFIFVSNWMYNMFIKFVNIDPKIIKNRKHIIYNCIGQDFENNSYDVNSCKEYDFITIRNNLDSAKYGIDIVTNIAKNNPKYKFCVVGKGEFYNYYEKPSNLEWIDKNLAHKEIIDYLNKSKCALLPTRADAQGVMACEMATFGIPLVTSNIEVCKEIFEGFENIEFIDNEDKDVSIRPKLNRLEEVKFGKKNEKYFSKNTVGKEIELFRKLKG